MTFHSRRFRVGPLVLDIDADESAVLEQFESLFSGFDEAAEHGRAMTLKISRSSASSNTNEAKYQAAIDGDLVCASADSNELALAVTRRLNRAVLDAEPERLHLHAGAVRNDDSSILVIGSSFAGKSTLVAKLVAEGWRYLSDEQVGVTSTGEILSYPRPITLRRNSWQMFEHLEQVVVPTYDGGLHDRFELSPTALGAVDQSPPAPPTLVICPDASTDMFSVERLTAAETLGIFVSDSLDLERAAQAGINAIVALAAAAPAYRVSGQNMDQKLEAIAELATESVPPGDPVEHTVVGVDETSDRVVGTVGWLFPDGSSALYEPILGALIRLDTSGYRAWQLLATAPGDWPDGLATSGFVTELIDAGVVRANNE